MKRKCICECSPCAFKWIWKWIPAFLFSEGKILGFVSHGSADIIRVARDGVVVAASRRVWAQIVVVVHISNQVSLWNSLIWLARIEIRHGRVVHLCLIALDHSWLSSDGSRVVDWLWGWRSTVAWVSLPRGHGLVRCHGALLNLTSLEVCELGG